MTVRSESSVDVCGDCSTRVPSLPALYFCSSASNTMNPITTLIKIKSEWGGTIQPSPPPLLFLSPSLRRMPWALQETIPQTSVNNASYGIFFFELLQTWSFSPTGELIKPGRSRQRENREGKVSKCWVKEERGKRGRKFSHSVRALGSEA